MKKNMKVYVKWDPLYEEVVCVHKTETGHREACDKIRNENRDCYTLEYDEYEVQE